jgi:hypothetical protein
MQKAREIVNGQANLPAAAAPVLYEPAPSAFTNDANENNLHGHLSVSSHLIRSSGLNSL